MIDFFLPLVHTKWICPSQRAVILLLYPRRRLWSSRINSGNRNRTCWFRLRHSSVPESGFNKSEGPVSKTAERSARWPGGHKIHPFMHNERNSLRRLRAECRICRDKISHLHVWTHLWTGNFCVGFSGIFHLDFFRRLLSCCRLWFGRDFQLNYSVIGFSFRRELSAQFFCGIRCESLEVFRKFVYKFHFSQFKNSKNESQFSF